MRRFPRLRMRTADMNHIGDRIPLAIQLANLLLIDFEQKGDVVIVLGGFCLHGWQIESPARSRVQNAHQSALSIAIANMKLHENSPYCVGSSFKSISDSAAPAGT